MTQITSARVIKYNLAARIFSLDRCIIDCAGLVFWLSKARIILACISQLG